MERFEVMTTPISDLRVLRRKPIEDARGFFELMFCVHELADILAGRQILQINRSLTRLRGAVRGMHYQKPPSAEMKLVTCIRGRVFDVAVDIRRGSPTFLQWHGIELSADNHLTYVIPEGFAHGFQTLEEDCELLYLTTAFYNPRLEDGIHPLDRRVRINWPLPMGLLSDRDAQRVPLSDEFHGI